MHKQVQMVGEPIVLQPRQHGVKLENRHHSRTLVAQHAFEDGVVAGVEPLPSSNGVYRKSTHAGGTAPSTTPSRKQRPIAWLPHGRNSLDLPESLHAHCA